MLVSQVLIVFGTIRKNPGLNLDELATKINEEHGDLAAAMFLTNYGDHSMLKSRICELSCTYIENERYYYKPGSEIHSPDPILDSAIKGYLEAEKARVIHQE